MDKIKFKELTIKQAVDIMNDNDSNNLPVASSVPLPRYTVPLTKSCPFCKAGIPITVWKWNE